jgi:hypothetical protein
MKRLYVYDPKKGKMVAVGKHPIATRTHGAKDWGDPDVAVPRALKSMGHDEAQKFIRGSGFSEAHIKRVWDL